LFFSPPPHADHVCKYSLEEWCGQWLRNFTSSNCFCETQGLPGGWHEWSRISVLSVKFHATESQKSV
jgi:hypothetical protein